MDNLQTFFAQHPRIAVAFSGGVDSSYLLYVAKTYGCDVHAYFIQSPFQPDFERKDAYKLAKNLQLPFTILEYDVLQHDNIRSNGPDRCYHCKSALFTYLWRLVQRDGFDCLIEGTNASDQEANRPGIKALRELQVHSPLREHGMTKAEIRRQAKQAGLFVHNKPAYACLATRIPENTEITRELLQKIEQGEKQLQTMGFTDFRLRFMTDDSAKLQVHEEQLMLAMQKRHEIIQQLSGDFRNILLDLIPRKQSDL